jgi:hypothetical protein
LRLLREGSLSSGGIGTSGGRPTGSGGSFPTSGGTRRSGTLLGGSRGLLGITGLGIFRVGGLVEVVLGGGRVVRLTQSGGVLGLFCLGICGGILGFLHGGSGLGAFGRGGSVTTTDLALRILFVLLLLRGEFLGERLLEFVFPILPGEDSQLAFPNVHSCLAYAVSCTELVLDTL